MVERIQTAPGKGHQVVVKVRGQTCVENLPEYAVYLLSTARITYIALEHHSILPNCNRESSDVLFRITRKGGHHYPKEDNLARRISEGTQKVEPPPGQKGAQDRRTD